MSTGPEAAELTVLIRRPPLADVCGARLSEVDGLAGIVPFDREIAAPNTITSIVEDRHPDWGRMLTKPWTLLPCFTVSNLPAVPGHWGVTALVTTRAGEGLERLPWLTPRSTLHGFIGLYASEPATVPRSSSTAFPGKALAHRGEVDDNRAHVDARVGRSPGRPVGDHQQLRRRRPPGSPRSPPRRRREASRFRSPRFSPS